MATLTAIKPTAAGVTVSLVAATATTGDKFLNTGREILIVDNASAAPITVTISAVKGCDVAAVLHDLTPSVTNATRKYIAAPKPAYYADGDTNLTTFVCSSVTSVTVGYFSAP